MAAQHPARASPELRGALLSPRYRRNYTTLWGTTGCYRWSCFFDQNAARLRWLRVSHQAAILTGSILLAWTSSRGKMPWVEWGRSAL